MATHICFNFSWRNHCIFFFNHILVSYPSYYTCEPFPNYSRHQSSKITNQTFCSIYSNYRVKQALILLRLLRIVELKIHSCSNQIDRVCQYTADYIGRPARQWSYHSTIYRLVLTFCLVTDQQKTVESAETLVNRVENSRKWYISDQWNT